VPRFAFPFELIDPRRHFFGAKPSHDRPVVVFIDVYILPTSKGTAAALWDVGIRKIKGRIPGGMHSCPNASR
jgi:hypothetical protein